MTKKHDVFTLHRYFIWADRMRVHFDSVLQQQAQGDLSDNSFQIDSFLYMSYWYAGIYVVIEGWLKLGLKDPAIDFLLQSRNVDLLRRYRNAVFHFQWRYHDDRFVEFWDDGKRPVDWIRTLNSELGRWFLEWFKWNKNRV